jgi:hypothetical protein
MITGRVLTSGSLLADLRRPVRGLDGGPFDDHYAVIDLRDFGEASARPEPQRAARRRE